MDWKALKNKALDISVKAMDVSSRALEKWKELAEKAKDAQESLKEKASEITDKAIETKDSIVNKIEDTEEKIQDKKEELSQKVWEIKENIEEKKEEVSSNSKSFFDKAKDFWSKALEWTTWILAKTAPIIKTLSEFQKIKNDKTLALLFLKKEDENCNKLWILMPLFIKDSWTNMITFKVIDIEESQEIIKEFEIISVPQLVVLENGEEKKKTNNIEEIKKYFKDFII